MAVRHVPVRHKETREERLLPETALRHFPDWERIDPETGQPLTDTGESLTAADAMQGPEPGEPADDKPATTSKTKGRASAKDTKE